MKIFFVQVFCVFLPPLLKYLLLLLGPYHFKTKQSRFYLGIIAIEKNNRMGKTRDLFKKIRDTKGTFLSKMGSIKDRNCMDLTEAENIKKRWQETHRRTVQKRSS